MNEKVQIITTLRDEFNRWDGLLTGISEEQIAASNFIGLWSIKDIVAHLTTWQQISVARMEAARYSREPEYPKWPPEYDLESEDDVDKINTWIYGIHHERPWSDIHREWRERYLRFLEFGDTIPEIDLLDRGRYPWLKGYPLSAVLHGSYEHHEEHLKPLIVLLRWNEKL